jgi:RHS repeat-associated protein
MPVDVVSGACLDRMRDFIVDGPAPIEWARYYDSRAHREDRGLGLGHRHSFDHELRFDLDGITYAKPDGTDAAFSYAAIERGLACDGGYTLTQRSDDNWLVTRHAEPALEFHLRRGETSAQLMALHYQGSDGAPATIRLRHDRYGRVSQIVGPNEIVLVLAWNRAGYLEQVALHPISGEPEALIEYRYTGNLLTEGIDAYAQRFSFRYHADGRMASRTDRRGFTFYWEFDGDGRCIHNVGDGGLLSVALSYKPLEGRTSVVDANGGEWIYEYGADGAITTIVDPCGGRRRFENGPFVAEYDELGAKTEFRFDHAGAPIAKISPDGDVQLLPAAPGAPDLRAHHVPSTPLEWEQGDFGQPDAPLPGPGELSSRLPAPVQDLIATSSDPRRGRARPVHDIQGLLVHEEVEDGAPRRVGYTADGGVRRVTDHDGAVWRLSHTSWNHVAEQIDPLGCRTLFEYSLTEQVTAAVDAGGVRSEYVHDLNDRIVEVRRGGATRERYAYDAAGNVTEVRGADEAVRLRMRYDGKGHLLERVFASGDEHTFEYDDSGRYVKARTQRHACTFAHDGAGRRLEDKRDGLGVGHRFDRRGLAETIVFDRFRIEYRRDRNGGMVVVDPTGGAHRMTAHGGGVYTRELCDGFSETTQYHPRGGRVLGKALWSTRRPTMWWARTYRYSGEGCLLSVQDTGRGETRYRYDAARRLTERIHTDNSVDRYEYTPAGSLYRGPGLDATAGELNRLAEANGQQLDYDDRGHLATRTAGSAEWRYTRDSRDQLVRAERTDGRGERREWQAEYDPFARRVVTRTGDGAETQYYWDTDRLAAERFADGSVRIYVYADAGAMTPLLYVDYASLEAPLESGRRRYVLSDQRGCPERILDETGAVIWQARIDPYGRAEIEIGAELHQPLRFPGHWYDAETGLHYNRFRYYDPSLGRYLESDPLGLGGGPNVYAYPANPLVDVDVLGLNCASTILVRNNPDGSRTILEIAPVPGTGPQYQLRQREHYHRPGSRTVILGGEELSPGTWRGGIVVEEVTYNAASGPVRRGLVSSPGDLARVAQHYGDEVGGLSNMRRDGDTWRSARDGSMRIETEPHGHPRRPGDAADWNGEGPHVAVLRPKGGNETGEDGWTHEDKYFIRNREDYSRRNKLDDRDGVFRHTPPANAPEPEPIDGI